MHNVTSLYEELWMFIEQDGIVGNQGCQLVRLTQSKYKTKTKFYLYRRFECKWYDEK